MLRAERRERPRALLVRAEREERPRALTPAEIAWIALLPCALVGFAAIMLLGPPLGHALFRPSGDALWPPTWWEAKGRPEPVEHGRYLVAVMAPLGFAAAVILLARRPPRLRPSITRALVIAGQLGLVAFAMAALIGQRHVLFSGIKPWHVFQGPMLIFAGALLIAALLTMRIPGASAAIGRIARERRTLRIACAAVAVVVGVVWLLEAVQTDRLAEDIGLLNWTFNDVFAVLDGHDPLVDYHLIYAKLVPYGAALALLAFGKTGFVYTLFLTTLSLLALLGVYATFRRVTRSSLLALGLFVPFVGISDLGHTMAMPAMWPMRYGGAYLLAWLTARLIDGERPRRAWVVFLIAGVVAINDLEFGIAAMAASVAALLCARPPRSARDVLRLAGEVGAGAAGAIACVSVLTLVRAGSLPKLDLLLEWPRIFTSLGWFSLPLPQLGLHLAIYATLCGAIAVATVRMVSGDGDVLLTGMLAWSGVFGLLASSYYLGRSDEIKLAALLSLWCFALALLMVVCVRALSARGWRAPTPAELLVLFGFALAVSAIGHLTSPTYLVRRLRSSPSLPAPHYRLATERQIGGLVARGEKVAILLPEGFRIAYELGLDNVAPYQMQNAVVTRRQFRTLLDAITRERVTDVFLPSPGARVQEEGDTAPEQAEAFLNAGFHAISNDETVLHLSRELR
jgi:hypothetical protein